MGTPTTTPAGGGQAPDLTKGAAVEQPAEVLLEPGKHHVVPIGEAIAAEVEAAQPEVEQLVEAAAEAIAAAESGEAPDPDAPVYDERGNVRPRGTKGARPMSYAERVAIAAELAADPIVDDRTDPLATPPVANPKQKEQD